MGNHSFFPFISHLSIPHQIILSRRLCRFPATLLRVSLHPADGTSPAASLVWSNLGQKHSPSPETTAWPVRSWEENTRAKLWPYNNILTYHPQSGAFGNLGVPNHPASWLVLLGTIGFQIHTHISYAYPLSIHSFLPMLILIPAD